MVKYLKVARFVQKSVDRRKEHHRATVMVDHDQVAANLQEEDLSVASHQEEDHLHHLVHAINMETKAKVAAVILNPGSELKKVRNPGGRNAIDEYSDIR